MACFILVHGGGHGGWCWDKVVPLIEAEGHRAIAPDLPGMGADTTPHAEVTLARWGGAIADLARAQGEPAILVGHSRGGAVIGEAAEIVPEAVRGLIYVTALLFPAGTSVFDGMMAGHPDQDVVRAMRAQSAITLDPVDSLQGLYHRADPADAAWAAGQLCPDPVAPNLEPLTISAGRWGRIRRAYIECADDRAVPIALQRSMQAALPCDPVVTLDSDHSPFLCKPRELADAIMRIAAGFAAE